MNTETTRFEFDCTAPHCKVIIYTAYIRITYREYCPAASMCILCTHHDHVKNEQNAPVLVVRARLRSCSVFLPSFRALCLRPIRSMPILYFMSSNYCFWCNLEGHLKILESWFSLHFRVELYCFIMHEERYDINLIYFEIVDQVKN